MVKKAEQNLFRAMERAMKRAMRTMIPMAHTIPSKSLNVEQHRCNPRTSRSSLDLASLETPQWPKSSALTYLIGFRLRFTPCTFSDPFLSLKSLSKTKHDLFLHSRRTLCSKPLKRCNLTSASTDCTNSRTFWHLTCLSFSSQPYTDTVRSFSCSSCGRFSERGPGHVRPKCTRL